MPGSAYILLDGLGPNLMARFDRDVIARSGVRWAICSRASTTASRARLSDTGGAYRVTQITAGYTPN
jgi:hypothetical protein